MYSSAEKTSNYDTNQPLNPPLFDADLEGSGESPIEQDIELNPTPRDKYFKRKVAKKKKKKKPRIERELGIGYEVRYADGSIFQHEPGTPSPLAKALQELESHQ